MNASISKTNLKSFKKSFNNAPNYLISRNALTRNNIIDIAMNWDSFNKIDHNYYFEGL